MQFRSEITVEIIIHATEETRKVFESFSELFGIKEEGFTVTEVFGHFQNPIKLLRLEIKGREAGDFIKRLLKLLIETQSKDTLLYELETRIHDSGLHLRLDKQEFVNGNVRLYDKESIKIRISTPVYKKRELLQTYKNLLLTHLE